jgi:phosphoglycerol transferase
LAELAIPRAAHRQPTLNKIATLYQQSFPLNNENLSSTLGFFGILGFVLLLFIILLTLSGRNCDNRLKVTALIVLVLFMFGTIGGFGSLFAMLISPSIRAWNRISIFISFGALLGLFLSLQLLLQHQFSGRRLQYFSLVLATIIAVIGFFDQTTPACLPCNKQAQALYDYEQHFIQAIEQSMPQGAAIYQLPYIEFPEGPPVGTVQSYELASGYIHSKDLRWNFGGMKGRPGDLFYRSLAQEPIKTQLETIQKLGFSGIYIDCRGFADHGKAIISELTRLLNNPPTLIRDDNEIVFFRIKPEHQVQVEGVDAQLIIESLDFHQDNLGPRYVASLQEGIDFTRGDYPSFVASIQGLSGTEHWGRWSDANLASTVRITFTDPLPDQFTLVFSAIPFKPNTNKNIKILIGSDIYEVKLQKGIHTYEVAVNLKGKQIHSIAFAPPKPTPPRNLGVNGDKRRLGVGLVSLSIR